MYNGLCTLAQVKKKERRNEQLNITIEKVVQDRIPTYVSGQGDSTTISRLLTTIKIDCDEVNIDEAIKILKKFENK